MKIPTAAIIEAVGRIQRQMDTARLVGKMVTQFGSREINEAIRNAVSATKNEEVVPSETTHDQGFDLAISNYTTLSAIDIVTQLVSLTADELRAIATFENGHRMRQTILLKIDQLLQT